MKVDRAQSHGGHTALVSGLHKKSKPPVIIPGQGDGRGGVDIGTKVLLSLGISQNRQPALMSLSISPSAQHTFIFSIFIS